MDISQTISVADPEGLKAPGGVLWNFHTYVGLGYFLGFKILNFNIFGDFKKKLVFFGVWRFCGYFIGGHHKIGLYLGVISMHFRVFSYRQGTEWGIFFGSLKFQIFFGGAWNSWYFLFGCWARAYVWRKKESTPPGFQESTPAPFPVPCF